MNKLTLKNLYPEIRPWERIRLLLAADQRKDEVEYQRLFDASPIKPWYFSEHLLAELSLHVLTLHYITEQLNSAASLFLALFNLQNHSHDDTRSLEQVAELSAYSFTCNYQGWKAFCDDLKVHADSLVQNNHVGSILPHFERLIPAIASTAEELQQAQFLPDTLITSSDLTRRWHQRLREMVQCTPPDTTEVPT